MAEDLVRELAHTADIGFEAEASTLERLFGLAAEGLIAAIGATAVQGAAPAHRDLELEKPDLERLLVAWLRELLHLSTVGRCRPSILELRVRRDPDAPPRLAARLSLRPWDDDPVREIKGVTYHGLRVERRDARWHARVVLDV